MLLFRRVDKLLEAVRKIGGADEEQYEFFLTMANVRPSQTLIG